MELKLGTDEQIAAALVEGVRQAMREPAFIRLVVEQIAGEVCWLTLGQVGKLLGRNPRTVSRWLAANKIKVSESLGPKDRRVQFKAVRDAMDAGTIRAAKPRPQPPGPKGRHVQASLPTPVQLRAVTIRPTHAA